MSNQTQPDAADRPLAIIAGYGPVGRTAAEKLADSGFDIVIIDKNPQTAGKQAALARKVVQGSCCEEAALRLAGIEHAAALILAVPDEQEAIEACKLARRLNSHIFIAARTNFLSRGIMASQMGADAVVVEEVVTAEAMRQAVVEHLIEKRGKN
ncbi:MAG: NAD-binding protein [Phycisphaeraceae bacterium]|nr:NAD-binding protein [Phycisphaeraceae bacterium]